MITSDFVNQFENTYYFQVINAFIYVFLDRWLLLTKKLPNQGFFGSQHDLVNRYGVPSDTNDHGYVAFAVITIRFSHYSSLYLTGFATRVTDGCHQWSKNLLSFRSTCVYPCVFSRLRAAQPLVFYAVFCTSLLALLKFLYCLPRYLHPPFLLKYHRLQNSL